MKLIRADGHKQQQWALAHEHAQTIASILEEHLDDTALLRAVAVILQQCTGERCVNDEYRELDQKLIALRNRYILLEDRPEEHSFASDYVSQLLEALHKLYHQPVNNRLFKQVEEQINCLRGAVVELLSLALISPRYPLQGDECANSRKFVNRWGEQNHKEVDVAAISEACYQLEGYECKLVARYFANEDLTNLRWLYNAAMKEDYRAQVGAISFDASRKIMRRLRDLEADSCIQIYGIDRLGKLRDSPFDDAI